MNAGTATINAASGGSTINMTDSAHAYTLAGGAGVDIITVELEMILFRSWW